jgi:hypothetical protein
VIVVRRGDPLAEEPFVLCHAGSVSGRARYRLPLLRAITTITAVAWEVIGLQGSTGFG